MFNFHCPTCNKIVKLKYQKAFDKRLEIGKCSSCESLKTVHCKRCTHSFVFSRTHADSVSDRLNCLQCKDIPDSKLVQFNLGTWSKRHVECPRCNHISIYNSNQTAKISSRRNYCRHCKPIPARYIAFLRHGKYILNCCSCNRLHEYKSRSKYLTALSDKSKAICSKCDLTDIIRKLKYISVSPKVSDLQRERIAKTKTLATKLFWRKDTGMPKEMAVESLNRSTCRIVAAFNLTDEQREQWKSNLKKSFLKYKGKNHWMHRPDVMFKIKESCEKYKGDNHWFRSRPKSLRKLRLTWKNKLANKL